jgi:transaldolase
MPQATLAAVADHGDIRGDTIRPFYTDAHQVLQDIAAVGVDYDDVVDLLEDEGIQKFEASWTAVTAQLSDRLRATPQHPNAANPLPSNEDHP